MKKQYGGVDGLRTAACIGIVMMHMRAENSYAISGFLYDRLIASFTDFVFLFMVISAFGMCCGYLERILKNQISLEAFYAKRIRKILPFFAVLVLLDVVIAPSRAAVIEGFADLTLLFGLFPNTISVIGVGWFLGLVFAFYLIFPFFCVAVKNRRRAWGMLILSLALNYVCGSYFGLNRMNLAYSLCYFAAGGLLYQYREELERFSRRYGWVSLGLVAGSAALYYAVGEYTVILLLTVSAMLVYALGRKPGGGIAEPVYQIFRFHQHGSLSLPYGNIPCG